MSLLCRTQIGGGDARGCGQGSPVGYFARVWRFSRNSWKAGLSRDSRLEHLHVASSFLTWWPQGSQTVYVASPGSQREGSRQQGKNFGTFYNLVVEVTWHQFCGFPLVKLITSLLIFKGRGYRSHLFTGEMSKNSWPCFEITKKFSAQMSPYQRSYPPFSLKLPSLSTIIVFTCPTTLIKMYILFFCFGLVSLFC